MPVVDMVMRALAITILIFAGAFLVLTLMSFYTSDLAPARQSLTIALIASLGAALPVIGVLVAARSASGEAPRSDNSPFYFKVYAALAGALAIVLALVVISGQLRL